MGWKRAFNLRPKFSNGIEFEIEFPGPILRFFHIDFELERQPTDGISKPVKISWNMVQGRLIVRLI